MPPLRTSSPRSRQTLSLSFRGRRLISCQTIGDEALSVVPPVEPVEAREELIRDVATAYREEINTQRRKIRDLEEFIEDRRHWTLLNNAGAQWDRSKKWTFQRVVEHLEEHRDLERKARDVALTALKIETELRKLWEKAARYRTDQGAILEYLCDHNLHDAVVIAREAEALEPVAPNSPAPSPAL